MNQWNTKVTFIIPSLKFKCKTQYICLKTLKFPSSQFGVELKCCEQKMPLCKCVTFIPRNKMRLRWLLIRLHGWCNLVLPLPHTHTRTRTRIHIIRFRQCVCPLLNHFVHLSENGMILVGAKRKTDFGPRTKANDLFLLAWRNRKRSIYMMYRFDDMTIILHKIYGYVLILFSSSVPYYIYWFDLTCYEICETYNYRFCKTQFYCQHFYLVRPNAFPAPNQKTHTTSTLTESATWIFGWRILYPQNTWTKHIHGECRHLIRLPNMVYRLHPFAHCPYLYRATVRLPFLFHLTIWTISVFET